MAKYYVELEGGNATIVEAKRRETAHNFALAEFGRSHVRFTRLATNEEIEWNRAMGGIEHQAGQ